MSTEGPSTRCHPRGACIDLYSTLVHEDPANPFYARVADELGIDLDLWLLAYRRRGKDSMSGKLTGMAQRVHAALTDSGLACSTERVDQAVDAAFPLFARSVILDEQAMPLLQTLRERGYRMALVSNASSYSIKILRDLRLPGMFDSLILSCQVGLLKPDPRIYELALADLRLAPADCVFIGDGGDDELAGAHRAGIFTVLVDRGLKHSAAAKAHANEIVVDLREVAEVIR